MTRAPDVLDLLPDGADIQQVGKIVNRNYIIYHLTKQQLHDLQDWVNKQRNVKD
jgi:hypothetical protein